MKKTSEYIEENLFEDLTLDTISAQVNMSKFHLLRLWKGVTHTGLMEYVRRRRLALSLTDLMHTNSKMDLIAEKYGFGSERTYNRAFKEEYGVSPSKWRRNSYPLEILDRFNLEFLTQVGEGLIYFKAITILPAFSIAGIEYRVSIKENLEHQIANQYGKDFFGTHVSRIINPGNPHVYIGYTQILPNESNYTLYQPSVEINSNSIVPEDMCIKEIKTHKYGVFTYIGTHRAEEISSATLSDIWQHVYECWMPTVEFNLKESFRFERIDLSRCKEDYCECDLYYPINPI